MNLQVGDQICYSLPSFINFMECTVTKIEPPNSQNKEEYPIVNIIQHYYGPAIVGASNTIEKIKKVDQKLILMTADSVDTLEVNFEFDAGQSSQTAYIELSCVYHTRKNP